MYSRRGKRFTSFLPAIGTDVLKNISGEVRRWRLRRKTLFTIGGIAKKINPSFAAGSGTAKRSTALHCVPSSGASTPT